MGPAPVRISHASTSNVVATEGCACKLLVPTITHCDMDVPGIVDDPVEGGELAV